MGVRSATDTPDEVRRGTQPAPGSLPVGSPGKTGLLEIEAAVAGGRTEIRRRRTAAPLHLMRPLYCDPMLPGVPLCYLMSSGGGVVGGDRLTVSATVGPGAHLLLTTQAATKIHRSDGGHATQDIDIEVGPRGTCEWVPDATIPFAGSRFAQSCRATIDPTGVLVMTDIVTAGRVGRGESWDLDAYISSVEVVRPDGLPILVDTTRLLGSQKGGGPVVTDGATVIGTCVVIAPGGGHAMAETLRGSYHDAAASTLADDSGAWLRVVGNSVEQVQDRLHAAWSAARLRYAGAPAPSLRKT